MGEQGLHKITNKLALFLDMIKIEHSIFALPFAYLGVLLASNSLQFDMNLFWVTLAMIGARSFAMAVNRYVDRESDARNPRTKNRALPKKLLTEAEVLIFSFLALGIYIISAFQLTPLCRYLWPVLIIPMILYPYTKRFTYLCHFVLGISLGLSPVGAWIAITNKIPHINIFILSFAICFWTAGFDIIYACQDIDFDKAENLYSIPACFGIKTALKITAFLHTLTVLLLITIGLSFSLKILYFLGVLIAGSVLWYENHIVSEHDLSRVNMAFFAANGFVSILVFVFAWIDVII